MKLSDWLTETKTKRKDFAARIQVSPSYVTALCNGECWPGRDVAERIFKETNERVTPDDFMAGAA